MRGGQENIKHGQTGSETIRSRARGEETLENDPNFNCQSSRFNNLKHCNVATYGCVFFSISLRPHGGTQRRDQWAFKGTLFLNDSGVQTDCESRERLLGAERKHRCLMSCNIKHLCCHFFKNTDLMSFHC